MRPHCERDCGRDESAAHDEGERRIPRTRYVEECENACGIDHIRQRETRAEDNADSKG
jgi:hypothetical protein